MAPPRTRLLATEAGNNEVANPEFKSWFCTDQLVRSWLFGTLSEEVLGHVHSLETRSGSLWLKNSTRAMFPDSSPSVVASRSST